MLRSLRHRDFRRFWIGFGIAALGFQVQRVGLGYLAYDLTGSALFLALVFSGDSIPMVLLSPAGGVLSDRVDRKRLLMASRCVVAALAVVVALLVWRDAIQTWHLVAFALATGVCYALDVPARQAMLHDIVPAADFVNAAALLSSLRQVSRIAGPALGSLALLTLGTQGTFAFMAAAQLVSVGTIALVHLPHVPVATTQRAVEGLAEGVRFIAGQPLVRLLLLISAIPGIAAMAYQSLTPVFAEDVLGGGSAAIGLMLSAAGVGALLGSATVARFPERAGEAWSAAASAVAFGLAVAAFAASRNFALSLALLVAIGATNTVSSIACSTGIQRRTPSAMQGRVMGIYQTTWELQVVGALAVGALADAVGAPTALALAGIVAAAVVAALSVARLGDLNQVRPLPPAPSPRRGGGA